jgi:type II secretory pathway component PulK
MKPRRDGGVALMLALLVLVILVILIAQMSVSSLHNRTVAENHLADLQNTYGTRAGYHQALLFLQADLDKAPEVDSLRERWAAPIEFDLGIARVRVTIADSERFINLSQLVNDKGEANPTVVMQFRRLVRALRYPPDTADRIIDYIDGDSRGEFESLARNERLFNLEELLRIEGLLPEIVYGGMISGEERRGLKDFVTLWPKESSEAAGRVNLNTAPTELFQSLSDQMTIGLAEAIVAWRSRGPDGRPREFHKVDELKQVGGIAEALFTEISGQLTVKSATFEIRARSVVGNVEKSWVYAVKRDVGQATPPGGPQKKAGHPLIGAQALNDFLSVKPPGEEKP